MSDSSDDTLCDDQVEDWLADSVRSTGAPLAPTSVAPKEGDSETSWLKGLPCKPLSKSSRNESEVSLAEVSRTIDRGLWAKGSSKCKNARVASTIAARRPGSMALSWVS